MGVTMHAKSDSDATSIDAASSPPRSPRSRPLYFVQSPSQHEYVDKMSYGSSPFASPPHQHFHYHCSPIHHSRESSTSRFSASLIKNYSNPAAAWKRLYTRGHGVGGEDEEDGEDVDEKDYGGQDMMRFYIIWFVVSFVALFSVFALILWAAAAPYKPEIFVKGIVFQTFNVQAGMDDSGVPTDMMTLNSTVRIFFRNPATFFGVHVSSTPLELYYYQLKVASGHMKKFYQSRKSQRWIVTVVLGNQLPLYGGIPLVSGQRDHLESVPVPLNLTFMMRSRAYVLGRLVKPKFYRRITCGVDLKRNHLGKHLNLKNSCVYKE